MPRWIAIAVLSLVVGCASTHKSATTRPGAAQLGATQPATKSPPKGATVLFDGKDLSHWQKPDGSPAEWTIVDGAIEVKPKAGNIATKEAFEDCTLHIEFRTPIPAEGDTGQHRGNSGIFLQSRYEIQVLESFELPASKGDCGAVYSLVPPSKNMALPPQQWQSYDMTFRAPRYDASGKKTQNARITLIWNGEMVQDNVEIVSPTHKHDGPEPKGPAPIELQDHGFKVQYRNIWIVPTKE